VCTAWQGLMVVFVMNVPVKSHWKFFSCVRISITVIVIPSLLDIWLMKWYSEVLFFPGSVGGRWLTWTGNPCWLGKRLSDQMWLMMVVVVMMFGPRWVVSEANGGYVVVCRWWSYRKCSASSTMLNTAVVSSSGSRASVTVSSEPSSPR